MIALPFHPSNTYTIEELNANLMDILDECEKKALVSLDGKVEFNLKIRLGIIIICGAGNNSRMCGRRFENICDAADILAVEI
jgi:aconitate hydratase